ncbi:DUF4400 domain-containing protein [Xanthomonas hortorum]|uniref:DUF4400 domain-containing protein n=1 Tax=Xanthomonas hortorum pv. hederae TaxID=453603 RepID=A0A9X3YZK6_9XANT|nr:DUF4400 domain-containing protein [Xanthomonas hortorum]MCE4369678.1 DUF4400 domain-containing protein [Xanthomonas hortorum pv. hederae]MDC8637176.1 DUF4400 domain-containing protein [Xanthomonas hortorum pv. hederae]PPU86218.1 hypothetical protein XhhCFBP4925_00355 [Xanthomonas hortorum pv. hederae]PUF01345.1 DUF4400 domain-containing protein [Xanthomonas hortorum pv. hederae]
MIRAIAVASLLALLVLVLYLPSAYPPQRFLDQLQADHVAVARLWGEASAHHVLDATLARHTDIQSIAPIPNADDAPSTERVEGAVAQEMTSVSERLFNSPYFRSLDAMLLLATYRSALTLKWLPWLALFPITVAVDSLVRRRVKALEFGHHDPEVFAVLSCGAIAAACATVLLLVLPVSMHPAVLPAAPILVLALSARAVANFHARP